MEANEMRASFNLLKEASRLANRTFNDREIESFLNKSQQEITKSRFAAWKNRPQLGYGQHPVRNAELAGLVTATQVVPRERFILGTEYNGALQGPDLDQGDITQDEDRFGVYVAIPNECLYILLETCETELNQITKRNVPIKEINLQGYADGIYDDYAKPYRNLVWSMDSGAFTSAIPNIDGTYDKSVKEYSSSGTGFNMQGVNYIGDVITINTDRARYLIPGKDWKITKYHVFYIKMPRDIVIDVQTPSLQSHCELPDFMHEEVVSNAVKIASAAIIPDPNQYQVNQLEAKENE